MKKLEDYEVLGGNYLDILVDTPLFAGVQAEDISAMLMCLQADFRSYERGEYLFHEGDPSRYICVTLQGQIHVHQEDYYGNRILLHQLEAGQVFGESYACAPVQAMPVSVSAHTDAVVIFLNANQIFHNENFCVFHQILVENLLHMVATKNVAMNQRICNTMHKTTRDKLLAYLMDERRKHQSNAFTIGLKRQELADYLGVDRSAMSEELGKLKREGILDTKRNYFELFI